MPTNTQRRDATRDRILRAAADLLREQGPAAVTTRRVAQEAGLQPPALYRLFQDKDALLDAAAEHVFAEHVAAKRTVGLSGDPVADLRVGWHTQIGFGLANPYVYSLLLDPVRARDTPAQAQGMRILAERVHRVAAAGLLRVSEERAVNLIHAAGVGTIHTLLTLSPGEVDPGLSDAAFDAIARAILVEEPATLPEEPASLPEGPASLVEEPAGLADEPAVPAPPTPAAVVAAFRALAPELPQLSAAEAALLDEWLGR
ncbi:TetR/AcrR family transcriptional regulator [Streptomyces sp. NPDC057253]|uniref:TetR/AcrR family transcriptional regulator n=1 Tax=Streptomyces sp. NPDC057253 TaxID=3346069 RepID=UPI00362CFD71